MAGGLFRCRQTSRSARNLQCSVLFEKALSFVIISSARRPDVFPLRPVVPASRGVGQTLPRLDVILKDHTHILTGEHLSAAAVGGDAFLQGALPDGTQGFAVGRFPPVHPASVAEDHVRCDGHTVELRPELCHLLPQGVVVVCRCDAGVTALAVQPAVCDEVVYDGSS